jgi:hypothetical protein
MPAGSPPRLFSTRAPRRRQGACNLAPRLPAYRCSRARLGPRHSRHGLRPRGRRVVAAAGAAYGPSQDLGGHLPVVPRDVRRRVCAVVGLRPHQRQPPADHRRRRRRTVRDMHAGAGGRPPARSESNLRAATRSELDSSSPNRAARRLQRTPASCAEVAGSIPAPAHARERRRVQGLATEGGARR